MILFHVMHLGVSLQHFSFISLGKPPSKDYVTNKR